jgi:hypothetical protein
MEYSKLTNQEIVDKMKILETEYEELKKEVASKLSVMEFINKEYNTAEQALKKRLNIK